MKPKKTLGTMTTKELVRFYGAANGNDDVAGPEFDRRGIPARDELIQMLNAIPSAELRKSHEAETIARILERFPSRETFDALEDRHSRLPGPGFEYADLLPLTSLRARQSGQMNDAWWQEHQTKSPGEADLHYCELLLANARPADRLVFLVAAAGSALKAYQDAGRLNDPILQSENAAKAESYAREILAIPYLAVKSGDGVYYGNHVLGMLALDRGDVNAAKHYLIAASKTPGSWMVNRIPGPNWGLAFEFIQRGELETVCEFLDNVKVLTKWPPCPTPTPKDELMDRWKEVIRAGGIPDGMEWFESNLPKKRRRSSGARGI
jgi:hypothetical protein